MNTIKEAGLYIFDMDGTLLDSMGEWTHLGRSFLLSRQIQPPENLEDIIETMTMDESAAYFRTLGVSGDIASINHEVMQLIHDSYRLQIPLKPGVLSLLKDLSTKKDSILCVLTTSERDCAENAFRRLGILSYFKDIHTSFEIGLGKRTGDIYKYVCDLYQVPPSNTVVFEDAPYAIHAAKEAGCYVYAVPEETYRADWEDCVNTADDVFQP